jgi:hypothetical protein
MSRKKGKSRFKNLITNEEIREGNILSPLSNFLNLQAPKVRESYFLGFKLKNVNQLWRWDDLTDVNF